MRLPILFPIAAATVMAASAVASAAVPHAVVPGESLYSVAAADGLSVDQLAAANGLSPSAQLLAGRTLMIPPQTSGAGAGLGGAAAGVSGAAGSSSSSSLDGDGDTDGDVAAPASATSAGGGSYVVQPGDTLSAIAARAGMTVSQLAAANGLNPNGFLLSGTVVKLSGGTSAGSGAAQSGGSGAAQSAAASAAPAGSTATGGGSYVVQPGDTLSGIAARAGTTVSELAAVNGLDPTGLLPSGIVLTLSHGSVASPGVASPGPAQAPALGTSITGRMTWFGGPHDPSAQGAPASGLGWRSDGMSYYNYGSLGHRWLIRFPWGQTLNMSQIDIGPAPWTGNPFDIAFSALPNTPYNWSNWPNPIVTGTYQGG